MPKPRVQWRFRNKVGVSRDVNNEVNSDKYEVSETSLSIKKVNYEDEGEYFCVSSSPRLKRNVSAILDVYGMYLFVIWHIGN